jgi:ubiquitin C-terminal hydrolase
MLCHNWFDDKGLPSFLPRFGRLLAQESLVGSNQYTKDNGEKINAMKQHRLNILPPILIFHVKRFEYVGNARFKLNSVFTFPFEVEMPIENEIQKYSLHGVILRTTAHHLPNGIMAEVQRYSRLPYVITIQNIFTPTES